MGRVGLVVLVALALARGVPAGVPAQAPASPADVAAWATRIGVPLAVPDGVQALVVDGGLVLADRGQALVIEPVAGDDPVAAALDRQARPFLEAGVPRPAFTEAPCRVAGVVATCKEATLVVAPGSSLRLLAGQGTGFTAICLDRRPRGTVPRVCAGVVEAGNGA